jgi:UDP-N-acetylglucosamine 3-dehydrogenase
MADGRRGVKSSNLLVNRNIMMKILIDGAGFIGEVHLKILLKYKLADVVVCEINKNRLSQIIRRYGIKEYYSNFNEAFEKGNYDGAVICTPNNFHANHAIRFLKKGIGVLVEKPMTHTVEDAKKIVEAAESNGTFIYVAYVLRHYNPFQKIKELISKGEIGDLFSMRAVVSSRNTLTDAISKYRGKIETGGSIIHDYSHEIDYSLWFFNKKVKEVYCKGFKIKNKKWNTFDSSDITLIFDNEKISSIHLDYIQPTERRYVELYGTKGTLLWSDGEDIKFYSEYMARWFDIRVDNFFSFDKPFLKQLKHYIDCLKGKSKPSVSGRDGLEIMEIIDACIESEKNKKNIFL